MRIHSSSPKGFTLIEMTMVLVVIGTMAVFISNFMGQIQDRRRIDYTLVQVEQLELSLNQYYQEFCGQAIFPQPTVDILIGSGSLPPSFELPAAVTGFETQIISPNTPRATVSILVRFSAENELEGFVNRAMQRLINKSAHGVQVEPYAVEFRSLTLINSTMHGYNLKKMQENYDLTGC